MKILLFSLLGILLLAQEAFADGVVRDSIGARTSGRGGVNLGFFDNGSSIVDNPAALANVPGSGFVDIGFDLLFTDLAYTDPDNAKTSASNSPFPMGEFSVVSQTGLPNVVAGIGFFSNAGFASKYLLNGPAPFSGTRTYKGVGALAKLLPALSFRATDRLSIGASFGLAINHMELEGPYFLQGPNPFAGTPTLFDLQTTGASTTWGVGLQYRLAPTTMLGLSYQSQDRFNLSGETRVAIPGLGTSEFDTDMQVVWPQSLGVGIQHEFLATKFGFDVVWRNWSRAFRSFDVTLTDPTDPVFAAVVGNRLEESYPLNWRDVISFKFGIERMVDCCRTVRAGYIYHRNPIPASTLTPFIQATLQHAITAGYTRKFGCCEFDAAYQYSFGSDASVGTSAFIGGDFDNSVASTSAHWASVGVVRRF